jgi:uncharacterized membrane protein
MIDRRLRLFSIGLSLLGIAVAGYLTYVHYRGIAPVCAGGCEIVQASDQSKLAGVPVALLGLLSYITLLVLNVAPGDNARLGAAVTAIIGFGFSMYLTYESIHVIGHTCPWCLGSATIMTLMAITTVTRLVRGEGAVPVAASPA